MEQTVEHWLAPALESVRTFHRELTRSGLPGPAVDLQQGCRAFQAAAAAIVQNDSLSPSRRSVPHVDVTDIPEDVRDLLQRARQGVNALKLETKPTEATVDETLKNETAVLLRFAQELLVVYDPEGAEPFRQARADVRLADAMVDTRAAHRSAASSARDVAVAKKTLDEQRSELVGFRDEQREALRALKTVQGAEAEEELAKHFQELGDDERKTAVRFRIATFLLVFVSPAPAIVLVSQETIENGAIVGGGIGIAIATAALYLGRLADGHMKVARWSQTLGVQARGVHRFADAIDDNTARVNVLQAFALHAYLGQPAQDPNAEVPPSTVAEIERLARTLSEASRSQQAAPKP